jgi:NAD(P)-dependent dehydrogenase (short-subunit alcohol dehydrogenase family)
MVTGAGSGMGRATANGLGAAGCKIAVADVNADAGESVAEALRAEGVDALASGVDHTDVEAVGTFVAQVEKQLGPIDILVNNAGILSMYGFLDMKLEDWDHVMNVNLRGPLICMQAIIPGMVERGRGSVVNIGSSYASRSALMNFAAGGTDYVVSKAALQALTRSIAQNVATTGVRVNSVAPGVVDTPMHARHRDFVVDFVRYIPLGRLQAPDDTVGAILYLASEASEYVTGQTIHVNGGMLMPD